MNLNSQEHPNIYSTYFTTKEIQLNLGNQITHIYTEAITSNIEYIYTESLLYRGRLWRIFLLIKLFSYFNISVLLTVGRMMHYQKALKLQDFLEMAKDDGLLQLDSFFQELHLSNMQSCTDVYNDHYLEEAIKMSYLDRECAMGLI